MKKLFALMLCIVLTLALFACSEEAKTPETSEPTTTQTEEVTEMPTETEEVTDEYTEDVSVEEMEFLFDCVTIDEEGIMTLVDPTEDMLFVQTLLDGLTYEQVPAYYVVAELTPDLFESDVFTAYVDGMTAVRCEPAMNAQPHSIVVLNVPEGSDVEAIRADIEANANPRKWVCVAAEQVNVVANGNTILLVMSTPEACDAIVANFNAQMAG